MATQKKKVKSIKELVNEPIEVATGITIEKLFPMFFDVAKLLHQPDPIYRMDMKGNRYYYRFEDEEPIFYTSVTTMIRNTMPTSPYLIQWLISKGGDGGKEEAEERASYGTFLHAQCADLLINGVYDLDTLPDRLGLFLLKEKIENNKGWEDDLKKDILAFAQFMIDYNVKPLAIEIILYHPTHGYAGALDLVCELDFEEKGCFGETYASGINKGQPKESKRIIRINAILDVKSGRKGFYESHEIQLVAYREMWQIHFPYVKIDKILNWSPKEWRLTPSYNLKDQTDSKNLNKLPHLVELSKIEASKRSDILTVVSGKIDLTKGLDSNIEELTYTQLIKKNKL
jgi:hypothetical protein